MSFYQLQKWTKSALSIGLNYKVWEIPQMYKNSTPRSTEACIPIQPTDPKYTRTGNEIKSRSIAMPSGDLA